MPTPILKKPTSSVFGIEQELNNQCHPDHNNQGHGSRTHSHTLVEHDDENSQSEHAPSFVASSLRSFHRGSWHTIVDGIVPHVSLVLENAGSVARDHLANERTWLAYVRTSLAIAGTGVALVQLFAISTDTNSQDGNQSSLKRFARPLGATTVLIGFCILCIGVYRYFVIQKAMTQGKFPVARCIVILISSILAALSAVIFGILIALPPPSNE